MTHKLSRKVYLLFSALFFIFVILDESLHVAAGFSSSREERRLLEFIATKLTRYSPHKDMINKTVFPSVSLFQILDVDEPSESIILRVSLSMYYLISSLVWSKRDFNGTTIMTFPSNSFWRPNFVSLSMFNVIDKTDRGQAVFGETGMVVAVSEAVTVACACDLDISHFPFDSQCCKINLAQWFASSSLSKAYRLDVNLDDYNAGNVDTHEYRDHDQWTLKTPVYYTIVTRIKGGRIYHSLDMNLCFTRIYHFWYIVLVLPALILYILSCFIFLLPAESGEKISFGVTILLSELVILGTANLVMPKSSSDIPIFGKFVAVAISNMGISILLTLFVLTIDIAPPKQPMPKFAKWALKYRAVFMFWKSDKNCARAPSEASSKQETTTPDKREVSKPALSQDEVALIARLGLQLATRIKKHYLEKEENENPWRELSKFLDRLFFVIYSAVAVFVIIFFHVWMES